MVETSKQHERLAVSIVESASSQEREALKNWALGLLEINRMPEPQLARAVKAIKFTASSKVVLPTLKIIAREIKKHGWDNRSKNARLGIGASAVTLATVGTQGAGIAALGTAIGVPLWFVFGAGAAFVGMLYDELKKKEQPTEHAPTTTYKVIDAKKIESDDLG